MEKLIVGNDDCKIAKIIDIMRLSPVIGHLDAKLSSLALTLDTPFTLMETIRKNTILMDAPATESLERMLLDWRSRTAENAKLTIFLEALEKDNLNDFSCRIKDHYKYLGDPPALSSSSGRQIGGSSSSGPSDGRDSICGASEGDNPPNGSRQRTSNDATQGSVDPEDLIERIKKHLVVRMPTLIELVSWNPALVARLQASGILVPADISELKAANNLDERIQIFFMLIHKRISPGNVEIYDKVITAFKELNQTGVVHVLSEVYSD